MKGDFLAGVFLSDCDYSEVGKLSEMEYEVLWGYTRIHASRAIVDTLLVEMHYIYSSLCLDHQFKNQTTWNSLIFIMSCRPQCLESR